MIALLLANLADFLTFACAMTVLSIDHEVNPVIRWAFTSYGLVGVFGLKFGLMIPVLALVWLAPSHTPFAFWVVVIGTAALVAGAISNTLAVVLLAP